MTTLAKAVGPNETVISLDVVTAAPYGSRATLDNEAVTVVGGDGTKTLSIWRAQNGTTAAAHPVGTEVVPIWYGFARWPVALPANSSIQGQAGATIRMPATGSIILDAPNGEVIMALPTVDPMVKDALWSNKGVVTVSKG